MPVAFKYARVSRKRQLRLAPARAAPLSHVPLQTKIAYATKQKVVFHAEAESVETGRRTPPLILIPLNR